VRGALEADFRLRRVGLQIILSHLSVDSKCDVWHG
jgi:hypothetical protein